jgi:hypothetical protein
VPGRRFGRQAAIRAGENPIWRRIGTALLNRRRFSKTVTKSLDVAVAGKSRDQSAQDPSLL